MKQKGIYIVVALLGLVGVFLWGASYGKSLLTPPASIFKPETPSVPAPIKTVDLLIDSGEKIKGYQKITVNSATTVLSVLKQVAQNNKVVLEYDPPEKSPYGAFVKQIGEQKNGTDGKYWQYWVNGVQPMVAVDKYKLKGGEVILWTFRRSAM